MTEFLSRFAATLALLAPWLILGFAVAGLLHAYVPAAWLERAMGGTGVLPILRAALIGVPLPLCSCSVVPVALELRKRGAGRGATAAFLVSTPESGIDSIAASYALLHPWMVVARPVAALVSGIVTGLAIDYLTTEATEVKTTEACCHDEPGAMVDQGAKGLVAGLRYAFVDLFAEVSRFIIPAVAITAALTTLVEPQAAQRWVANQFVQMLVLLLLSIPIYVCASAATPIAAGLILAGFSPGAALVFLLAGPATNLATIAMTVRMFGKAGAAIYVACIVSVALLSGLALDQLFAVFAITPLLTLVNHHECVTAVHWTGAVLLAALVVWHWARRRRRVGHEGHEDVH